MNTSDLYQLLEEKRKLVVSCESDKDFYALRAGIYLARKRFLEAFAMIDDTSDEDGYQLTLRRDKDAQSVTMELVTKEPKRQWVILETPEDHGS